MLPVSDIRRHQEAPRLEIMIAHLLVIGGASFYGKVFCLASVVDLARGANHGVNLPDSGFLTQRQ